jgi:hypothetical protein
MITPYSYTQQTSYTASAKNFTYGKKANRQYDIEYAVLKVIMKQIEAVKEVEELRQELVTMHDWSGLNAFRVIDEYTHGNVNNDK